MEILLHHFFSNLFRNLEFDVVSYFMPILYLFMNFVLIVAMCYLAL